MAANTLGVAVIGCGNIARSYARNIARFPELEIVGVLDRHEHRCHALADELGVRAFQSLDRVVADDSVSIVLNLTVPQSHYEVSRVCLDGAKHVHSEKPLALTFDEACALVDLAEQQGVRLSCSPATFLSEAQQTAIKLMRDGRLGHVRVVYAEANWGMIESWHPDPQSFYDVGPFVDVALYPLAMVTASFGPARRVTAYGTVVKLDRTTLDGTSYVVTTPDFIVAVVELACGIVARLTTTYYVGTWSQQRGIEFHGDAGSLALESWERFDTSITYARRDGEPEPVPWLREPYAGVEWARALRELAQAIHEDRPHRASGRHAAHLVEILEATRRSYELGTPVEVGSHFELPQPMEWAR